MPIILTEYYVVHFVYCLVSKQNHGFVHLYGMTLSTDQVSAKEETTVGQIDDQPMAFFLFNDEFIEYNQSEWSNIIA